VLLFLAFFQKHLTLYTLPHVISGKIKFLKKAPSKCPPKLAISEGIFHLRAYYEVYRVCEGTNKSKRKNDKNAKKYHESFASCQVI